MLKTRPYGLIKLHKPRNKTYVIYEILAKARIVLKLPPYHSHLNTTELIWTHMKRWFGSHHVKSITEN